jgi:alkanesulfonate monooxygenase
MTIHLHWYLPTNGDSREIVGSGDDSHLAVGPSTSRIRPPTIAYLGEIARTAELLGFEAVLTPTGTWCEDAWITTAALTQVTSRLKLLVAFRPGFISPTLAAHQAATFQRVSGGRLLLNIVTGGDPVEQARFGDYLSHDERYRRAAEFLAVLRGVSSQPTGSAFNLDGDYYKIAGARIDHGEWDPPQVFFGGASPAAEEVAERRRTDGNCNSASGSTSSAGIRPPTHGRMQSGYCRPSVSNGSPPLSKCSPVQNLLGNNG